MTTSFEKYGFEKPTEFNGEILSSHDGVFFGYAILSGKKQPTSWDKNGKINSREKEYPPFYDLKKNWIKHIPATGTIVYFPESKAIALAMLYDGIANTIEVLFPYINGQEGKMYFSPETMRPLTQTEFNKYL